MSEACSELWMHLRDAGDDEPKVNRSRIMGLVEAKTSLEPLEATGRMRSQLHDAPDRFRSIYRIIPIQRLVDTDLTSIAEAAQKMAERIGEEDSFRVTVEKRRTGLGSREIVEAVAENIDRRVDLEDPDWVVLVEVIGDRTGVSVIPPEGILNVQKEKWALSEGGQDGSSLDY